MKSAERVAGGACAKSRGEEPLRCEEALRCEEPLRCNDALLSLKKPPLPLFNICQ